MTAPTTMTLEMGTLKTRLKKTWESGDYGVFAKYLEKGGLEFFDRLNVPAGARLLDVACGAGQLTLPAARKGIQVTGLDLAANLVQQARARAADEGLRIQIDEGDAENLPYPEASFDVVMSLIGAMFAPRPELVASEMIRVASARRRIRQFLRQLGSHVHFHAVTVRGPLPRKRQDARRSHLLASVTPAGPRATLCNGFWETRPRSASDDHGPRQPTPRFRGRP